MASELLFVWGVVWALLALNTLHPLRRPAPIAFGSFMAGWLVGELPLHHALVQVTVSCLLIALGGLDHWLGLLGFGLQIASIPALIHAWRQGRRTHAEVSAALAQLDIKPKPAPVPNVVLKDFLRPFHMRHPQVVRRAKLTFATLAKRHLHLDLYHHREPAQDAPVLIYIHGGGWTIGTRKEQGLPLIMQLAAAGWVCLAIDYRKSPRATYPDHLIDVKRAIAWARANVASYGGDPTFITLCGNSAGGHLAALAALSAHDCQFQPGFESCDTSVAACVPIYGVYDLHDPHGHWPHRGLRRLWEGLILKKRIVKEPLAFTKASPCHWLHPAAPPFFVIHGSHDSLVPVAEAHRFVEALRERVDEPCAYLEVPGAQHAFDIFKSRRSLLAAAGIQSFLTAVHQSHLGRHSARPAA